MIRIFTRNSIKYNLSSMNNKNSFNEMRLLLSLIVLLAHISVLTAQNEFFWFVKYFDSSFAVKGFFVISGYLVTQSFLKSPNIMSYLKKRARRIYPAYLVAIFYSIIIGIYSSSLTFKDFISDFDFIKYLFSNLIFLNFIQNTLPGSLLANPLQTINGSLWTLKIEVLLYLSVPILLLCAQKIGSIKIMIISILFGIIWVIFSFTLFNSPRADSIVQQYPGQLPFFVIGGTLGFFEFKKHHCFITLTIFLIYYFAIKNHLEPIVKEIVNIFIYSITILLVGKSSLLYFNIRKIGDFSYGIYLYHFPTIQIIEHYKIFLIDPALGLFLSIFISVGLAVLSWYFVEIKYLKKY